VFNTLKGVFDRINEKSEMNASIIGLDIATNVFHMYSLGEDDQLIKKSGKG
jgi:hypothetical protein